MIQKFTYFLAGNFAVSGEAFIEPSEPATQDDPAFPAIATIIFIYIEGIEKNAIDFIDPAIIQRLEADMAQEY